MTKRILISDIAKVFGVFGWFAPVTISMKILLQRVWKQRVDLDDPVLVEIQKVWQQWKAELLPLCVKDCPGVTFQKIFRLHPFKSTGSPMPWK